MQKTGEQSLHQVTRCFNISTLDAFFAERRERSEANNRILFEIPRYLYIYIYICLSFHVMSCHCAFGTQAAVQSTTLRSRPFARWPTAPVQLKTVRTTTATWAVHIQKYRTEEAQLSKPNCGTKGRTIGS